jgi:hypothetical protein
VSGGGEVTELDHLVGKPEFSVALYHAFVGLIAACGEYTVSPSKTTITFKGVRRGFAGARPDRQGLVGYLDLQRALVDPRITRVSPYTKKLFVHHYRIREQAELDDEFATWIREAYAVGQGAHLAN